MESRTLFPVDSSPLVFKNPLCFKPLSFLPLMDDPLSGLLSLPLFPFVLHSTLLPIPFPYLAETLEFKCISEYFFWCVSPEHVWTSKRKKKQKQKKKKQKKQD